MTFLTDYGLFLAKTLTFVIAIVVLLIAVAGIRRSKSEAPSKLKLTSLNEHYQDLRDQLSHELLDKKALKAKLKAEKKAQKEKNKEESEDTRPRLFVLDFDGDIEASAVESLAEHISAILQVAEKDDRVLLRLESGGGYVHSYGLAASQLARLRAQSVPLVISVDKVAASGGYMMACVGDTILAAPFAILGSVGVIGAVPNFHDLLEKNNIHYEQHTAGAHKRSLTLFAENTEADRLQFQKELNETHALFKAHIKAMRPQLDVESIATGETWYGSQALEKGLVDQIQTSDDYLLAQLSSYRVLQLEEEVAESLLDKLKSRFLGKAMGKVMLDQPFKRWIR